MSVWGRRPARFHGGNVGGSGGGGSGGGSGVDQNWVLIPGGTNTVANWKGGAQIILSGGEANSWITTPMTGMGGKVWRNGAVHWDEIEQSAGNFTFTETHLATTDNFITATAGTSEMLCGFSQFALSNAVYPTEFGNGASCPHFKAAISAAVTHYGANCKKYEAYNEPEAVQGDVHVPLQCLENIYSAVKAANPSADVFGCAFLDTFTNYIPNFLDAALIDGKTWKDVSDGFSFHSYGGQPNGAAHTPENIFARNRERINSVYARKNNTRIWLTETVGWANGGGSAVTQAVAAYYTSRYTFMMRAQQGVELISYYAAADPDVFLQGLYTAGLAAKSQLATYRDALVHCHAATAAKFYQHLTAPVLAVALRINDGTNRLALWGQQWKTQNDETDQAEASGNITFHCDTNSGSGGLLSVQTMGGGTTTSALQAGANDITIPYGSTAVVLSTNIATATFRGLSPV